MKKHIFLAGLALALSVVCMSLFSFTSNKGGDIVEIYLNGKQVHRQFVHIDKRVKTLQLETHSDTDKIEVFYSHCGYAGKNRILTLRNAKNELIKEFKFPDGATNRSMMGFYRKDLPKNTNAGMQLYYASKELPNGTVLATIRWHDEKIIAKRS